MGAPVTHASISASSPEQASTLFLADIWASLWSAFNAIVATYNAIVSTFNSMTGSSIPSYSPASGGGTPHYTPPPPPPPPPPPSPTMSISASSTSITAGEPVTIYWSSSNANSCTGGLYGGSIGTSGSFTTWPSETLSYSATCTGSGGSITKSVIVNVYTPPPTITMSADFHSINPGESATISWSSAHATSCTASGGWSGGKSTSGSEEVFPTSTTNYNLYCSGLGGSANGSTTVTVSGPSMVPLSVPGSNGPITRTVGQEFTIYWGTANVTSGSMSGPGLPSRNVLAGASPIYRFAKLSQSIRNVNPGYVYTITGTGPNGRPRTDSVTVKIINNPPNCAFSGNPSTIVLPQSSTLSWSCSEVNSCSIDQGIGSVAVPIGSREVSPTKTTTYTLSCSNPDGNSTFSTKITVAKPFIKEVRP